MKYLGVVITAILLMYTGSASAQCCSNTVLTVGTTTTSCCVAVTASPDESTIAAWAAKKAVAAQLDWFDDVKTMKLERAELDALQVRVDDICKWAKTLSNHIFMAAYLDWGVNATSRIEDRRRNLDKIDVAKSLVTGLPTPPESK